MIGLTGTGTVLNFVNLPRTVAVHMVSQVLSKFIHLVVLQPLHHPQNQLRCKVPLRAAHGTSSLEHPHASTRRHVNMHKQLSHFPTTSPSPLPTKPSSLMITCDSSPYLLTVPYDTHTTSLATNGDPTARPHQLTLLPCHRLHPYS